MSGLKNSPFGKRLRAAAQDSEGSSSSSPRKGKNKEYKDRYVPARDVGDMRTSYHLMEEIGPSTPSKNRVIPCESDAQKEQSNSLFTNILHSEVTPPSPQRPRSPTRPSPLPTTPTRRRIFNYTSPASNPHTPTHPRLDDPTSSIYSLSPIRSESRRLLESPRRHLRSVCKTPYRVLDAPDLADDFYLNLVDWSSTNVLGVGLGSCVYLWTAHNAAVSKLCDLAEGQNDTVSSVSWVQKGTTLAVGTLSGRLHIYDAHTLQLQRTYTSAHSQRIGALAWNSHVLSSGSRDRSVLHRDVREATQRPFKRCVGHRQEVCGLKWSGEGSGVANATLASGGNDNKVCIWDLRGSRRPGRTRGASTSAPTPTPAPALVAPAATPAISPSTTNTTAPIPTNTGGTAPAAPAPAAAAAPSDDPPSDTPLWKFHEHTAAVKALAWDPHVAGVLATGGGTQDKHIRFWNVGNGTMLNELDTGSQVCNLIWSVTSHELVSTHGFSSSSAQNQICIWKYPKLEMVASLTGHTNRVLYLAMSPDGETIVTGAGDETLRFWNAFPNGGLGVNKGPKAWSTGLQEGSKLDWGKLIR